MTLIDQRTVKEIVNTICYFIPTGILFSMPRTAEDGEGKMTMYSVLGCFVDNLILKA